MAGSKKFDLADYVEVPQRIQEFYKDYPNGTLCGNYEIVTMEDGAQFVVFQAFAFRSSEDTKPGVGTAWEPYPGKTTYTKDSELMNAETSAWGRALAALGYITKKIASYEEVRNRQSAQLDLLPQQEDVF